MVCGTQTLLNKDNEKYAKLFQAWQNNPAVAGVFIPKSGIYPRYGIFVEGPKVYIFDGNTVEGIIKVSKHDLQHEMFHVEMHAMLQDKLGIEKYKKIIDKIPKHIKEEYVVHRFLNTKSKVMDIDQIKQEIQNINTLYRPKNSTNLTKEYLKDKWNLKDELKILNINY